MVRNGTIIFFLRDDKPAFMRAFENTVGSMAKTLQTEQETER